MNGVSRFRKNVAGLCLIGAPAVLFVGTAVHPGLKEGAAAQLKLIARHPDQWYLNHLLGVVSMVLFIPAIFSLMHLLRDREPGWGYVGGALSVLGTVGFTGLMTIYGFVAWQMAASEDQTQMAELFRRLNHTAGVVIPFRAGPFAFVVGLICLAIGLYRAGIAGLSCLAIAAGPILFAIGGQIGLVQLMIPASGMMTMGLGSIGLRILREPDASWEVSPPYRPKSVAEAG
jgi:hypothetical protein